MTAEVAKGIHHAENFNANRALASAVPENNTIIRSNRERFTRRFQLDIT